MVQVKKVYELASKLRELQAELEDVKYKDQSVREANENRQASSRLIELTKALLLKYQENRKGYRRTGTRLHEVNLSNYISPCNEDPLPGRYTVSFTRENFDIYQKQISKGCYTVFAEVLYRIQDKTVWDNICDDLHIMPLLMVIEEVSRQAIIFSELSKEETEEEEKLSARIREIQEEVEQLENLLADLA